MATTKALIVLIFVNMYNKELVNFYFLLINNELINFFELRYLISLVANEVFSLYEVH